MIRRAWFEFWNWWFFHVKLPTAYWFERGRYALFLDVRVARDAAAARGARFGRGWLPCVDVGPGWLQLVERLEADLFRVGWDGERHQIKEKYGALRFYCSGDGGLALWRVIILAERESERTCESCAAPGRTRGRAWQRTLCDACEGK